MNNSKARKRRQFLKNTSLATLGLGLASQLSGRTRSNAKNSKDKGLANCKETTLDYYGEGPFYTENPPSIENGQLAGAEEAGDRMIISGRVFNLDCSQVIPNAIVDVWHADHEGDYDNEGFRLRGQVLTNEQGFYLFETIKPGKYKNGSRFRPAHIHYKITPPDFPTLITQLYFDGDSDLASDPASSITDGEYDASSRIIPLSTNTDGKLEGTFDIMITGEGVTGVNDLHLNKGMLYTIAPNPFTNHLSIKYGVFKRARVSLLVYSLSGHLVATLEERILTPEKYEAFWEPSADLPAGHYFIALKINDLQVHYQKVIRVQA
ncbi:MAG: hypothetical protein KTR30_07820 [Saprospiraceae bacterium]|nr:hypothetical protein [Saprospiraceae bacterium]